MKLLRYFKTRNPSVTYNELNVSLAELARGCAREGYVTYVLMRSPQRCICCDSGDGLCPMRVPVGGAQVVSLLCLRCQQRISDVKMLAQMIYEVRRGIKNAEPDMQMGLLVQQGQRIRLTWGHQIGSEVLS